MATVLDTMWLGQQFDEFLPQAKADPAWLITCLQDTRHDLTAGFRLVSAVYHYAYFRGCVIPNPSKSLEDLRPLVTQWLIDMHEAGESVTYNTLKRVDPFLYNYESLIFKRWKSWLRFTITGEYYNPQQNWVLIDYPGAEPRCA